MNASIAAQEPINGEVARFAKNTGEIVVGRLTTFNGHRLADIRVFIEGDNGGWIPTKKGVAVRLERLPDLLALVGTLAQATSADAAVRPPTG